MSIIAMSDLHLGALNSQTKKIDAVLDIAEKYDTIIIVGDLINSYLNRLGSKDYRILKRLSLLNKSHRLVVVRGNHDIYTENDISLLTGIQYCEYYIIESGGKLFYFEHGDYYDSFIIDRPYITCVAELTYNILQAIDKSHTVARLLKHSSKQFIRCSEKVRAGILDSGARFHCDWAIAGHTHHAELNKELGYINTGCFTENPCTYVTIKDGEPRLCIA